MMAMVVEAVHSRKAEEVVEVRLKKVIEEVVVGHSMKVKEAAIVHCLLLVVAV
jgi:hypothetical protein